jgi:hypothetical protein
MEQVPSSLPDNQYRRALRSLRAARNWFAWLLLLMLLMNLAAMAIVRFWPDITTGPSLRAELVRHGRVTDPGATLKIFRGAVQVDITTEPASAPASAPASRPTSSRAEAVYVVIGTVLPFAMSMGLICALLMVALQAMSLLTVLAGRIGDAGYMASALAWSLVLAALVAPWNLAFGTTFMPGVMFLRPELIDATATVAWGAQPAWPDLALYCSRFVGYPVVAALVWLLIQLKAHAGARQPTVRSE